MGGPGAGKVTRHELNAVPQSHVGHGERALGEPPASDCRCHPPERSSGSPIRSSAQQLPPSPPPLTSLHLGSNNGTICAVISGNNNSAITTNPSDGKAKRAAAMSSPPKHRRGFDPNDPTEFHRYRRVKTKQRGFVCPTSCDLRRWTQTSPRSLDTSTSTRHYKTHTSLRCSMLDRLLVVPPPLQRDESTIT
ncbi:PREDICTED: serine/arginine repetitive matrix protein 2-like [Acromyrmex echinatior]|uniref:serine/arginine repetitive matrix protein 2-like n=1 Tax=Acromyrmex echinatior TaxID=103372 RepID=UPI000580E8A2|nr:PREDICTED: serine/arginine repetitive matrix protein 2-like [Acromyrmex echinatior]XP_011060768.1 PREDICTED: serine/arginine repetitive matrix protein 2-like [Acromyrmex echinatior]